MLTTYVEPKYFLMFVVWVLLHTPKIFRNSLPFVLLKKVVLVIAGNREEKVNGHSILIKVACCRNSDNSEKNLGLDSNSMQKKKICKRFYTWLQILAISMTFSNSKIKKNYQNRDCITNHSEKFDNFSRMLYLILFDRTDWFKRFKRTPIL